MKPHQFYLIGLLLSCSTLHAQVYNDGAMTNAGGIISDWTIQYISTAGASYSTAGSTGAPSSFGTFEHRGQSGTGTAAAMVNNGSYNASVFGHDYFMGPAGTTGQQEISGSTMPVFNELFIQNGATSLFDVTNTAGIRVTFAATFSNGITTTIRSNTYNGSIKFGPGATYSGANTNAQHVNGYVSKEGTDAFTFPVGDGTQLRTLQMASPNAATNIASVAWFTGNPNTVQDPSDAAIHSTSSFAAPIMSVSNAGFWDWIPQSGTFTNVITASIPDLSSTGVNAADLRLIGWNGAQWVALGTTGATGNTAGSTLSGNMQPGITAIGIGSISTVLPVLFTSFEAAKDGCNAMIQWSTAMERDNDHFDVERSTDGHSFSKIGFIQATGSSAGAHYGFRDESPINGNNFYRVTQVDADGEYSSTVVKGLLFDCGNDGVKVYPTVSQGQLFVDLPAGYEGTEIMLYTTLGQAIHLPATGKVQHIGVHTLQLNGLAQGSYLLKIAKGASVQTFKVFYQP